MEINNEVRHLSEGKAGELYLAVEIVRVDGEEERGQLLCCILLVVVSFTMIISRIPSFFSSITTRGAIDLVGWWFMGDNNGAVSFLKFIHA